MTTNELFISSANSTDFCLDCVCEEECYLVQYGCVFS